MQCTADNNVSTTYSLTGEFHNPYRRSGKTELEQQNSGAWQTSSISNPPPKVTTTSANLSHGEFTGEGM